jgi:hypothetical protein
MDHAANKNEVRLRKGESLKERLAVSGLAILVCLFAVPDLVVGQRPSITAIIALLIGCLLLASAILRRNVVWIITPAGILIGEQRPFRRLRSRLIERNEISAMHLRKDSAHPTIFSLAFATGSGEVLTSPPLADVTQVHETTVRVARLLALPDPEPADNPLDAINSEIRLGMPVEHRRGVGNRVLIVLIACLLSFPFIHALWNGQLSALGIIAWSLGFVVAIVLFRYAHRMSGTFWIIGDGEIHVERRALNGAPEVQTIYAGDVETIDVEPGNSEDNLYVIAIRLRTGNKIRSSELAGRAPAEALQAEIMRRLNVSKVAR